MSVRKYRSGYKIRGFVVCSQRCGRITANRGKICTSCLDLLRLNDIVLHAYSKPVERACERVARSYNADGELEAKYLRRGRLNL